MDTIYRERDGGSWKYWTYTSQDNERHYVTADWAKRQVLRNDATLITVR